MINLSFYPRCENYTYKPLIDALNIYHLSDICQDVSRILINPVYWKSEPVQSLGILARTGFHRPVCTNKDRNCIFKAKVFQTRVRWDDFLST